MLDPDILLSEDCPNPFERAPLGHVCMSPEWQYEGAGHRYPWMKCLSQWEPHFGPTDPRNHLQGGLCLYEPVVHGPAIEQMHRWWVDRGRPSHWPLYEQPLWSEVGERLFGLPILRISRLLNRHTPFASRPLATWGAHYSGNKKRFIEGSDGRGEATRPALLRQTCGFVSPRLPAEAIREWAATFSCQENCVFVGSDMLPLVWLASEICEGRILWLHDWERARMGGVISMLQTHLYRRKTVIVRAPRERYPEHVRSVIGSRPFLTVGSDQIRMESP